MRCIGRLGRFQRCVLQWLKARTEGTPQEQRLIQRRKSAEREAAELCRIHEHRIKRTQAESTSSIDRKCQECPASGDGHMLLAAAGITDRISQDRSPSLKT